MNFSLPPKPGSSGATLIEAVISIGVLAVAIPMVFGTLAESGKTGMSSRAETRAAWIIPACMDEIRASREGRPQYLTATSSGQSFPPAGDVWALAFAEDGRPIGRLSKAAYEKGSKQLEGKTIRYIATLASTQDTVKAGFPPMLRVNLTIEYPAAAGVEKRRKLEFHTRMP